MGQNLSYLESRSELIANLRQFFLGRNFIEVETPLLSTEVIPELHVEPIAVESGVDSSRDATHRTALWLQASPELHMKRLLSAGMKSIFQITRSFRAGERGKLHNPEFTIVEWYRIGDDMQAGMTLLDHLCQTVLGTKPAMRTSYEEAFRQHLGLCPHVSTTEELTDCAQSFDLVVPDSMQNVDRDECLNLLLATRIEPNLGRETPEILYDYPASLSALAKIDRRDDGIEVARRFELYWQGIELANGYDELTDAKVLSSRLNRVNEKREIDGRPALPLPKSLLAAMERGLPDCTGCALGFDRVVMLAAGAKSIAEVVVQPEF